MNWLQRIIRKNPPAKETRQEIAHPTPNLREIMANNNYWFLYRKRESEFKDQGPPINLWPTGNGWMVIEIVVLFEDHMSLLTSGKQFRFYRDSGGISDLNDDFIDKAYMTIEWSIPIDNNTTVETSYNTFYLREGRKYLVTCEQSTDKIIICYNGSLNTLHKAQLGEVQYHAQKLLSARKEMIAAHPSPSSPVGEGFDL